VGWSATSTEDWRSEGHRTEAAAAARQWLGLAAAATAAAASQPGAGSVSYTGTTYAPMNLWFPCGLHGFAMPSTVTTNCTYIPQRLLSSMLRNQQFRCWLPTTLSTPTLRCCCCWLPHCPPPPTAAAAAAAPAAAVVVAAAPHRVCVWFGWRAAPC
jgi:hypothetical protein